MVDKKPSKPPIDMPPRPKNVFIKESDHKPTRKPTDNKDKKDN